MVKEIDEEVLDADLNLDNSSKIVEVNLSDELENDYDKLTIKELKQKLTDKGIEVSKKNPKKVELLELIKGNISLNNAVSESQLLNNNAEIEDISAVSYTHLRAHET